MLKFLFISVLVLLAFHFLDNVLRFSNVLQVFSPTKEHALYLWIHLSPSADAKKVAKVVSDIQAHVDTVSPAVDRDESNEILAGVGFGPGFYKKVFIHSFILNIYIAPLQENCSEALPTPAWLKRAVLS